MMKRDDSGSGLRAGFVRGDGIGQTPAKKPAPKPEEDKQEKEHVSEKAHKPDKQVKPQSAEAPAPHVAEPAEAESPTITMQGVSGKKITGVVKVVKGPRQEKHLEGEAAPVAAASEAPTAEAHVTAESRPESRPAAEAERTPAQPAATSTQPVAQAQAPEAPAGESRPAAPTQPTPAAPVAESERRTIQPAAPAAPAAQIQPAAQAPEATAAQAQPGVPADRRPEPMTDRPSADRPQGQRPFGDRPQGDRPQGDRPQGDRPPYGGPRPQGERPPYGDRPQGDRPPYGGPRPQGDRPPYGGPQGDRPPYGGPRPQGDRPPYGDRPQGDRPQGDRPPYGGPQGDRPQGDRPPYGGPRPQGDRPPYGDRPQGDRPPYGGPRPQGDRPPYGDRPQGDRPPYGGPRPQGDRPPYGGPQGGPPYGGPRPQGDRPPYGGPQGGPPYGGPRPQGDRPPYGGPQGGPPYGGPRPQGDRPPYGGPQGGPPYGGPRPQGDRPPYGGPQGGPPYGGPRPQGDRPPYGGGPRPYGDRPQGDRPPYGGAPRPYGDRPQGTRPPRPADEKEKLPEPPRSSFTTREAFKKTDEKRPIRKSEQPKVTVDSRDKHNKLKEQTAVISGEGVTKALNDEGLLDTLYTPVNPTKGKTAFRPYRGGGRRGAPQQASQTVRAVLTHVKVPENMTVKDFAEGIKKTAADVIKKLMKLGMMATVNQEIDFDTMALIAEEFGITAEKQVVVTEEQIIFDDTEDQDENLKTRPPVVVVMGHVDHGKTSILDRIRSANVVAGEAGGITQHIGAYTVRAKGRQITFLDTPGHEAFTTMRARGAQVTDIAILVVAADDGVMPQTIEAINHAKAAKTQIVVAINKIDKEGANIERVKQELSKYELIPEEWGGTTVMVPVSAKTGQGIDELLEMVLLTADILDLKADPDKQAKGTVIEAKLDKNRGPVATILVQRGTLRIGDTVVTGSIVGRVRAMVDDKGSSLKKAGPSIPVEILGLPEVPEAGELFYTVTDEKTARSLVERRRSEQREQQLRASSRMSLESLYAQMATGEVKDLNVIVKADVQGSVEAVRQSLEKLNTGGEVRVNIIHGGVGAITETDIRLADVSNAIVIGFNVRPATNVADLAAEIGVDVRMYRIIYNAIEDIQAAMKGMLKPQFKEVIIGHAEVRQTFKASGIGTIGGCYVTDGKIVRNTDIRVVRDGVVIHEGKLSSLKRFKDDAREVATGYECGLSIDHFNDLKEGDIIEAFEMKEVERS